MDNQDYAVLGIHGADVPTVNKVTESTDKDGKVTQQVEQRNVVRVRMFVGDQMIDEDFNLPHIITIEEQIDTAVTARIAEITANGAKAHSDVVPEQTEQIIADAPAGEDK